MKKYILIAGVNGVGKSTFYQTLDCFQNIPRINTDEIAYRVAHGGHGIPDADGNTDTERVWKISEK